MSYNNNTNNEISKDYADAENKNNSEELNEEKDLKVVSNYNNNTNNENSEDYEDVENEDKFEDIDCRVWLKGRF